MLTPKMSLRRNNILGAYKSIIEQLYLAPADSHGKIDVSTGYDRERASVHVSVRRERVRMCVRTCG
jgi:hypothetical protein